MPERHLHTNLTALVGAGHRDPAAWLATADADGELEYEAGEVTGVSLRTRRGLVRMHGRRDTIAEAERLLPPADAAVPLVILIGAGAGFALDALERRGGDARTLLVEPSAASLRATLSRRSWERPIAAGQLRMLAGPDFDGWLDLVSWLGRSDGVPPIVVHPVIARERPGEAKRAAETVRRLLFNAAANEAARRRFAGPYLLNTLANLRHLVGSRDVGELFGRFGGVPAFLLAAGPSLNRNLEEIRSHRDHALLIAVDTALRPCLAAGIEPDFVAAVDPGEPNLRHLAVDAVPARTHLVAEPSLAPGAFEPFDGRVFTFRVDRHHPWPWLLDQGIERARLLAWGSVFTTTLDLAVKLGCDPIVLVGADFAYTGGQPYCRGTVYEEDWARAVAGGVSLEDAWRDWMPPPFVVERGIDGRDVRTSARLLTFRDWVAAFCRRHSGVRFVNATGAGVLAAPWIEVPSGHDGPLLSHRGPVPVVPERIVAPDRDRLHLLRQTLARGLVEAAGAALGPPWREWGSVSDPSDHDNALAAFSSALDGEAAFEWRSTVGDWRRSLRRLSSARASGGRSEPATPFVETPEPEAAGRDVFRTNHYLQYVSRRLEHLASLELPLAGTHVLETGAGGGQLTGFFLDRGCHVVTTDARETNLAMLRQRFRDHAAVSVLPLDLDPPPPLAPTSQVVFCYGTLYHLSDPEPGLEWLSRATGELLLIETIVAPNADERRWIAGPRAPGTPNDSVTGGTCRPGRKWLFEWLRGRFPFVYVPITQPSHHQFPTDWDEDAACVRRAIFVASRSELTAPLLVEALPARQSRQP